MSINQSRSQRITKPAVESRGGIVVSQSRIAAEAGASVLARGGNAVDAAVVTALALGAAEPWMSGLGGGGAMLVAKPGAPVAAVDFGMIAPAGLDPADYPTTDGVAQDLFPWPAVEGDRNLRGATSIAVPGQVAGLSLALERFGTLAWADALAPAIALAERGLVVDWYAALMIATSARELDRFAPSRDVFLPGGYPPAPAWVAQPATEPRVPLTGLAATLRRLAEAGPREFYEGETARAIAADVAAAGGPLALDDLNRYHAHMVEPQVLDYRGTRLHVVPPLTGGPTLLRAMSGLAGRPRPSSPPDAAAFVGYAEAMREAFAHRFRTMGDGAPAGSECTSHLAVVDRDGMMVALTQTLLSVFGSKLVLPSTGILMNNGVLWFDPEPGKPNSLGPAKRCLANYCPAIGLADGTAFALGASGGRKIIPAVMQLASFLVDCGMTLDQAFHQPRIDVSGTDAVVADDTLPQEVRSALADRFTTIPARRAPFPYHFACAGGVMRRDGVNWGANEKMSVWGDAVAESP